MTILKSSSNKKKVDTKLVGVLLPRELHAFFSLYTVAKCCTKTIIIIDELHDWANTVQMCGDDETELIKEVIVRIREKWNTEKIKTPEKTMWDFKRSLKTELRMKGISETHITQIIKGI
jgi:hypothetical protein